ncbi:MAG TPA: hypothetical protein VF841_07220 [Anaeromyxobacter sp.]
MTRAKILMVCIPIAAAGLALGVHATFRVNRLERQLATLASEGQSAGASFVETLHGDWAERQRVAFDRRREIALDLAAARRDRLLGVLAVAAAGLAGAALTVLSRIAAEIEEDQRHVAAEVRERRPDRS